MAILHDLEVELVLSGHRHVPYLWSIIDVDAGDGSTCRYCLAEWAQAGPSAVYSFLDPV